MIFSDNGNRTIPAINGISWVVVDNPRAASCSTFNISIILAANLFSIIFIGAAGLFFKSRTLIVQNTTVSRFYITGFATPALNFSRAIREIRTACISRTATDGRSPVPAIVCISNLAF